VLGRPEREVGCWSGQRGGLVEFQNKLSELGIEMVMNACMMSFSIFLGHSHIAPYKGMHKWIRWV
jgi:hypothetical protein